MPYKIPLDLKKKEKISEKHFEPYSRRIHNQDPVIVVDGSCCFRKLYGELDWVCGGQYKEYVDVITNFIDGFESEHNHLFLI